MPLSRCVLELAPVIRLVKAEKRPVLSGVWCVVVQCRVLCVCVYRKTQENGTKRVNKRSGNEVIIVWEKTKMERNNGECKITRTPFLARYGQLWTKTRPKTAFFPRCIVVTPLGRFRPKGPVPNRLKCLSGPDVLIQKS